MDLIQKRNMRLSIFKLIAPILLSSILEMLVGFISMALIGNLGTVAIGAMGLSTRVRGIIWSVFKGIAIGVQVVVAQAIGAGDGQKVRGAIAQTIGSIFAIAALFLLSMLIFPQVWLTIFGARGDMLKTSIELLRVVAFGMPFLGVVIVISGALQGKGDALTPLIINAAMNVMNAGFGLVLVKGLLGLPALGLMGAGYAMVLSQGIAALMAIFVLFYKGGVLEGMKVKALFSFTQPILSAVYKLGLPSVVESLFWNISSILLIRFIFVYGNDAYAAYQLGLQAESLAYMPAAGFQVAATAFVGRYLGAKDPDMAKAYFREVLWWALWVSILGGGLLVFLPGPILGIMTRDQHLIQLAIIYLVFCGLAQVPQNIAGVLGGALRGAGYTNIPMITAGIGIYGIRIPLAFLAAEVFHWPLAIIFLAIALDMTGRLLLNAFMYLRTNIYKNPRIV